MRLLHVPRCIALLPRIRCSMERQRHMEVVVSTGRDRDEDHKKIKE
jgi:hypothetical protein